MLDYIFFDELPWQRFIDFLKAQGLHPITSRGDEGWLVSLPEEIDDDLYDRIEVYYDEMLELNETLVSGSASENYQAGVSVNLADGRTVQAAVDPGLLARLLDAVSPAELGDLVNAIVDAVENPDQRPFCQR